MILEPVKFLLVDDTEDNLLAFEALLRRDGLDILKARSGPEALELLLVHEVALAFLDVHMPGMGGFELAELMRGAERTKHVPIIFVTAGARDPQRVFKGYETGAVDFLYKPVEAHVLKGKADVFFELYKQKRELANVLRLNEMFVGILGHDLRNPLGAMLTGTQLLAHQLSDEGQLQTLQRIIYAGQRMSDMIEQLLDLTRGRLAGGLGFVRVHKHLDVANLVQRAVEELRTPQDSGITVEIMGDCTASGDPDRLLQLFSNLIANAVQHRTAGSTVSIAVSGNDREIMVRVKNRGVIPANVLPTLFDPFRDRKVVSPQSAGLGLGLYISEQIALAHGGGITVESSEPAGTVFTVRLPHTSASSRRANAGAGQKMVLIVDDDESIRDSLREGLEEKGYEVTVALNGEEAVELLVRGERQPDAVILNLMQPVIDGGRVYQAMRADEKLSKIPVIVSTSSPARVLSDVIVVPKPLKLDQLLDRVTHLFGTEVST